VLTHRGLPQARAFVAKAACCSACFLLTFLPAIASAGTYSGGSGTGAKPYRISTVSDWQELMATPADWASHFVLTGDLDLDGVLLSPVGNYDRKFIGVFDGNDHIILNADVNMPSSDYVGLFGYLGWFGQVKNLGVENISILGHAYVGGLVGCHNYGTIENCHSTGTVTGSVYVGGLVGYNWQFGTIINCYSTGSVTGNSFCVGGLVGENTNCARVTDCYSTGSVTGSYAAGGLVGTNYDGTVSKCYSTGSVGGEDCVGGLAGENINCASISNSYSTGSVGGTGDCIGGLVGVNSGSYGGWAVIGNCYSTSLVSGTGLYVGGLAGYSGYGDISSSFWDVNTSDWATSAGGTPKTTAEMETQSTFTSAGWDFIEVWDIGENQTYPFLRTYLAGDINHDGVVDFRDIAHLAESWLSGVE
jgi:hypothetical protein